MSRYSDLSGMSLNNAPVSEPISEKQRPNLDGGSMSWKTDKWAQMRRFLILGSDKNTYYATARKLTGINTTALLECLDEDYARYIDTLVEMRSGGIVPKYDTVRFALAIVYVKGSKKAKAYAKTRVTGILRTASDLEEWLSVLTGRVVGGERSGYMRGWGRSVRGVCETWMRGRSLSSLVYQAIKYRNRAGMSFRNVVKLTHPHPGSDEALSAVYYWIANGEPKPGFDYLANKETSQIWAYERIKRLNAYSEGDLTNIVELINVYRLPWEAVPTDMLNNRDVLQVLSTHMPINATVRQLPRMTRVGMFDSPGFTRLITERLNNMEIVKSENIHPLKLLQAYLTYKEGIGASGKNPWKPSFDVVYALEQAFYTSFGTLEPTGLRRMQVIDVSGSMDGPLFSAWGTPRPGLRWQKGSFGNCSGLAGVTPREAAAALAMISVRTESCSVMAFSNHVTQVYIRPGMTLDAVIAKFKAPYPGGTNMSLAIDTASRDGVEVDLFEIYTDNEANQGRHPAYALGEYQNKTGINAKAAFIAMVGYNDSVADPDRGHDMMDFVGFDTTTPEMLRRFALGSF